MTSVTAGNEEGQGVDADKLQAYERTAGGRATLAGCFSQEPMRSSAVVELCCSQRGRRVEFGFIFIMENRRICKIALW